MSDAKKFRFVSPGIFLNEIDQSYLSAQPTVVGPVIIGRTEKGPGMVIQLLVTALLMTYGEMETTLPQLMEHMQHKPI